MVSGKRGVGAVGRRCQQLAVAAARSSLAVLLLFSFAVQLSGAEQIPSRMRGAVLPGNSQVDLRDFDVPKPGHGEVREAPALFDGTLYLSSRLARDAGSD
eukprot:scaffold19682_cov28-Tisochrysis_lutea.AAC.2